MSSPVVDSHFPVHPGSTLGAAFFGEILAAVMYGVTNVQIFIYSQKSCSQDHVAMKYLIFVLWILDTAHIVFLTHAIYYYCVINFMNPSALEWSPWSLQAHYVAGLSSDCLVIGFYMFRIWKLGARYLRIQIVAQAFVVLIHLIAGAAYAFEGVTNDYPTLQTQYSWLYYLDRGTLAAVDISISISLCFQIFKMRTGIRRSDSLVRVLVMYSVSTCALTSVLALGSIITLAAFPKTLIYSTFTLVLPKMTLNSMLAWLNLRDWFRGKCESPISIHVSRLLSSQSIIEAKPMHCSIIGEAPFNNQKTDTHSSSDLEAQI